MCVVLSGAAALGCADGDPTGGNGPPGGAEPIDAELVSDFNQPGQAMVLPLGSPLRNGTWYAFDYGQLAVPVRCTQTPLPGGAYAPDSPPATSPGSGGLALHAAWDACEAFAVGIGADFNVPLTGAPAASDTKVPYDVSAFSGITFLALALPNAGPLTDTQLRVALPLRATTPIPDGGLCAEPIEGRSLCGDHWRAQFVFQPDGSWHRVTVRFSDAVFKQDGWGVAVPWNPADVTGVQIQPLDSGELYDFWIDDVALIR
ncbi:MAG TPA: hypothetical protein VIF57_13770 [Polyangia bacterium]